MDTLDPSIAPAIPADAQLVPPHVTPPANQLPLWRFIPTFIRNPIATMPQAVYEERFVYRPKGNTIYVTAPDLIERLLLSEVGSTGKTTIERRALSALGDGLLTSEGASWKWQRRTTAPVFRHADLMALIPAMVTAAEELVAAWRTRVPGGLQAIDQDMEEVTFNIISRTIFAGAADSEGDKIGRAHV